MWPGFPKIIEYRPLRKRPKDRYDRFARYRFGKYQDWVWDFEVLEHNARVAKFRRMIDPQYTIRKVQHIWKRRVNEHLQEFLDVFKKITAFDEKEKEKLLPKYIELIRPFSRRDFIDNKLSEWISKLFAIGFLLLICVQIPRWIAHWLNFPMAGLLNTLWIAFLVIVGFVIVVGLLFAIPLYILKLLREIFEISGRTELVLYLCGLILLPAVFYKLVILWDFHVTHSYQLAALSSVVDTFLLLIFINIDIIPPFSWLGALLPKWNSPYLRAELAMRLVGLIQIIEGAENVIENAKVKISIVGRLNTVAHLIEKGLPKKYWYRDRETQLGMVEEFRQIATAFRLMKLQFARTNETELLIKPLAEALRAVIEGNWSQLPHAEPEKLLPFTRRLIIRKIMVTVVSGLIPVLLFLALQASPFALSKSTADLVNVGLVFWIAANGLGLIDPGVKEKVKTANDMASIVTWPFGK